MSSHFKIIKLYIKWLLFVYKFIFSTYTFIYLHSYAYKTNLCAKHVYVCVCVKMLKITKSLLTKDLQKMSLKSTPALTYININHITYYTHTLPTHTYIFLAHQYLKPTHTHSQLLHYNLVNMQHKSTVDFISVSQSTFEKVLFSLNKPIGIWVRAKKCFKVWLFACGSIYTHTYTHIYTTTTL